MGKVNAIVFDAGGTLICPAEPVGDTYARIAKAHRVHLAADVTTVTFHDVMKTGAARGKGGVPTNGDDREWWKIVVRQSLPPDAFTDEKAFDVFFEDAYLHYAKPSAWEVYPEVLEVLEALRDFPVDFIVLSNWDGRLHGVLDGLGLGEYFPRRFISAELGWEKPDSAIYRHVSESLKIPPAKLLSVGDNKRNDVDGPKKAGWQGILINRPKVDLWAVVDKLS